MCAIWSARLSSETIDLLRLLESYTIDFRLLETISENEMKLEKTKNPVSGSYRKSY